MSPIIDNLEKIISDYDNIIVFDCECQKVERLFHMCTDMMRSRECPGKNLILAAEKDGNEEGHYSGAVCIMTRKEYSYLLTLYHTYEFSDRIHILGQDSQFGSLVNYIDTGVLTEEEFVEAILY